MVAIHELISTISESNLIEPNTRQSVLTTIQQVYSWATMDDFEQA